MGRWKNNRNKKGSFLVHADINDMILNAFTHIYINTHKIYLLAHREHIKNSKTEINMKCETCKQITFICTLGNNNVMQ